LNSEHAGRLNLEIERIRAGEDSGDVLLALLRVTAKHLRRLNLRTRERVVLEFIRTVARVAGTAGDLKPESLKQLIRTVTNPPQPPVRERAQLAQYPPKWWCIPEYRSRRRLAKCFLEDYPLGEFDETRFAVMKGILSGLLTYSSARYRISLTKQGKLQGTALIELTDGPRRESELLRYCAPALPRLTECVNRLSR
jgi:hypothetical protein